MRHHLSLNYVNFQYADIAALLLLSLICFPKLSLSKLKGATIKKNCAQWWQMKVIHVCKKPLRVSPHIALYRRASEKDLHCVSFVCVCV